MTLAFYAATDTLCIVVRSAPSAESDESKRGVTFDDVVVDVEVLRAP